MAKKNCEECRGIFEPARRTQRFCSTRCANRQRDRRRRKAGRPGSSPAAGAETAQLNAELKASRRQLETKTKTWQRQLEILQSKVRCHAAEIDRLEAENSEQRVNNNLLQSEVARLKRAQRTNVRDLAHIAAWLVSLSHAKGVALDATTVDILRRRGWTPKSRQAGASRL